MALETTISVYRTPYEYIQYTDSCSSKEARIVCRSCRCIHVHFAYYPHPHVDIHRQHLWLSRSRGKQQTAFKLGQPTSQLLVDVGQLGSQARSLGFEKTDCCLPSCEGKLDQVT
jgi:hypothetical protein